MKTISDHVLDIVQNSVRAKATLIEIIVVEDRKNDLYTLTVNDNGRGMSAEVLNLAATPFFTSRKTRKVGMGLSLLKQNAEASSGFFHLESEPGKGTTVQAVFKHSHLDRPPLSDIWTTLILTVMSNPAIRLIYSHSQNGTFKIDSEELLETLDGVSLKEKEIRDAVTGMIKNNLQEIEADK